MSGHGFISVLAQLDRNPGSPLAADVRMLLGHIKAVEEGSAKSPPCGACVEDLARLQHRRANERAQGCFESTWGDEDEAIRAALRAEAVVALDFSGGCRHPHFPVQGGPELMVLGFAFSPDFSETVMVRKKSPAWQAGLLNGPGGHRRVLSDGPTGTEVEDALTANVREFREETGLDVGRERWTYAGRMSDAAILRWEVQVFTAVLTVEELERARFADRVPGGSAREQVVVPPVGYLLEGSGGIGNIPWLVAFCRDVHRDPPDPMHAPPRTFDVRY